MRTLPLTLCALLLTLCALLRTLCALLRTLCALLRTFLAMRIEIWATSVTFASGPFTFEPAPVTFGPAPVIFGSGPVTLGSVPEIRALAAVHTSCSYARETLPRSLSCLSSQIPPAHRLLEPAARPLLTQLAQSSSADCSNARATRAYQARICFDGTDRNNVYPSLPMRAGIDGPPCVATYCHQIPIRN